MLFLIDSGICMDFVILVLSLNMVWQNKIYAYWILNTYGMPNAQYKYYCFIQFYWTCIRSLPFGKWKSEKFSVKSRHFVGSLMFEHINSISVLYGIDIGIIYMYDLQFAKTKRNYLSTAESESQKWLIWNLRMNWKLYYHFTCLANKKTQIVSNDFFFGFSFLVFVCGFFLILLIY